MSDIYQHILTFTYLMGGFKTNKTVNLGLGPKLGGESGTIVQSLMANKL